MSQGVPRPGIYTRKSDGTSIVVIETAGSGWLREVIYRRHGVDGERRYSVRLENFWKKYTAKP